MKYMYFPLALLVVFACTEGTENGIDEALDQEIVEETLEQKMIRHLEGNLSILGTEKYVYKIFSEHLNGDDSIDYIITVNRLEKALEEAIESGKTAQRAEMGYVGNYNFFFFMDGASKTITTAIPVPSSPHAELSVSFANIRTEAYKDFMIDFRVRNSCFRRFYTVMKTIPSQTFETKIFDFLGEENVEAYSVEFKEGSYSLAKDIYVYKAKIENVTINSPNEVYTIQPIITPTDQLERKWFFNEHMNKYYTEK